MANKKITAESPIYGKIEGTIVDKDDFTYHIELSSDPSIPTDKKKKGDYIEVNKHSLSKVKISNESEPIAKKK